MKMLCWDKFNKFANDDLGEIPLESKPILTFQFDDIRFVHGFPHIEAWRTISTGKEDLTPQQIAEVISFIDAKRQAVGVRVMAVDSSGKYLGRVLKTDPRFHNQVNIQPPNDDPYRWVNGEWVRVYPVNELGYSCSDDESVIVLTTPPPDSYKVRWSTTANDWVDPIPVQTQIDLALLSVLYTSLEAIRQDISSFDNEKYVGFIKKIAFDIKNAATLYPELSVRTVNMLSRVDRTIEELSGYAKERNDISLALAYLKEGFGPDGAGRIQP